MMYTTPEFRAREAALEPRLQAAEARDETVSLTEIAAALDLDLLDAIRWITRRAMARDGKLSLSVTGLRGGALH